MSRFPSIVMKATGLIKALSGATLPGQGRIAPDGRPIRFRSPIDARRVGIETVYQNRAVAPAMSIAVNLFPGRELRRAGWLGTLLRMLDKKTAALGVNEGNRLPELIRRVRDKGLPVILISHNLPHVFEIADRIHVARLGRRAAVLNPEKIGLSDTVAAMTGALAPADFRAECLA